VVSAGVVGTEERLSVLSVLESAGFVVFFSLTSGLAATAFWAEASAKAIGHVRTQVVMDAASARLAKMRECIISTDSVVRRLNGSGRMLRRGRR